MLLAWMYILWLHTFRWHTAEDVRVCFTLFTPSVRRMPDDALHGVDCRAPCLSLWRRRQYLQRALQLSRSERVKTYLFLKSCAPFRFFLWYSHRKKQKTGFLHVFLYLVLWPVLGGGGKQLDVSVSKSNPRSMRARPLLNKFAPVKPAVEDINDLDPLGSGAQRPQATRSIPNQ